MLRTGRVRRDVRQVHVGLLVRRQLDLGFLSRLFQALHGQGIRTHVDALLLAELVGDEVDDALVEVFAAQEGIAVGGQHFELVLAVHFRDLDDGDVEGAAAQVIHGDLAITLDLVHAIGERRRGGLVDDALHVETGDLACVLGGLALGIVEIGRHGDNRFGHRLAEIVFGGLLHLHEHARGDLRRRHLLAAHIHPGIAVVGAHDGIRHHADVFLHHVILELAADEALDGVEGVARVGDRLTLGGLAHRHFVVLGEGHDGRGGTVAFAVLDDPGLAALHDGHAGIGGTQVDADDLAHNL